MSKFQRIWRGARLAWREPREALLAARMAVWVVVVTVGLRLMSLPRMLALTEPRRLRAAPAAPAETQERLARLLDALLGLDWLCFTPTCWKRAAVLNRYLALNGIASRVVFGVRQEEAGRLEGHAWLEIDGQPALEKAPPDYTVTFSHPSV